MAGSSDGMLFPVEGCVSRVRCCMKRVEDILSGERFSRLDRDENES